ncbi:MAG: ABC-2 family transporter protein [Candidatus Peribacteria bacterium]|jgi:ABC-type uncharacterized transport system permease subunit|nr:ABC-2 family transporter protein [Candidatus Peribacteria bacterium]
MKKYLQILGFAFKEQLEYRRNFFFGIITMVINDAVFLAIFAIFLSYFTGTGLDFGAFLLIFSITAFHYAIVNGMFANLGELSEIIEGGKMDYYLSFPVSPLLFLSTKSIKVHNLGDVLFSLVVIMVYVLVFQEGNVLLFIGKRLMIMLITIFFVMGLFILVGSVSFRLQRGSKVRDLFQSFFIVFGSYPPDIFIHDKTVFILISLVGLYPGVFLPYRMMIGETNLISRLLLL